MIVKKMKWMIVTFILAVVVGVSGCSNSSDGNGEKSTRKKIVVGVGNEHKDYSFLDNSGKPVGFEIDLLNEVDKLLPQYDFEYKSTDFNTVVINLETGKIDMAAHQFEINPERQKKFLYGTTGISTYNLRIAVRDDRNDINSLEDLAKIGGTVEVGKASSNSTYLVDKWNKENGNRLNIVLKASDDTVRIKGLESGKTDAVIEIERIIDSYKKIYNAKLKVVGEPLNLSSTYYIYPRNNPESKKLQEDVDQALKTLKENGTLLKLSEKWLGGDYTDKN